ncbi:Protein-tyrosine phosphatase [Caenorhabditis elegans]|uniref:Protein-tyrosine phosphatase n=1 Tax=Caenorhabditis elegans TaxID=6239 RepID=O01555_CAEEL|nr:Protein-tyrosine phosphatase [Caenorhabditis elegans]NP_491278.1 Protein-tyrosine phosphatase [Caenorhabditis elegans]CCD70216.1 Protein-tyrosine phosphatase [Caenorhabditis elegans]CCD70221.2 Protein-tyrosine phosphatase [Caenorhabditis elegans]|eukprot:NP_491275.3 Tyrosine-protein phosphatase [Caenorhabditis elegans]
MCFAKKNKNSTLEQKKKDPEITESSKNSSQPSQVPAATPTAAPPSKAHQKAMIVVKPWVQRTLDMGVQALVDEFRVLAKWTPEGMTTEAFSANTDKNRYQDVPCQDKGRIVVKFPGLASDYIHANYLGTATNPKKFICAQGPLENTQHSFWAMAIQEKVECVIMLCNCIETGKIKCHQYWPLEQGQKLVFGEAPNTISVANLGAKKMAPDEQCINVTTLKVDWGQGSRTIQHLQWENWPDRGVPQTNLTAINLLSATRGNQNPILVHCSAGIGRTGTIVAIAYVQDKMMAGENCMAMNELIKELRSHRPWSIQNEFQYLYLHRVLLSYFLERYKETYAELLVGDYGEKYKKWADDYAAATATK